MSPMDAARQDRSHTATQASRLPFPSLAPYGSGVPAPSPAATRGMTMISMSCPIQIMAFVAATLLSACSTKPCEPRTLAQWREARTRGCLQAEYVCRTLSLANLLEAEKRDGHLPLDRIAHLRAHALEGALFSAETRKEFGCK
jgi:hypothetical protein